MWGKSPIVCCKAWGRRSMRRPVVRPIATGKVGEAAEFTCLPDTLTLQMKSPRAPVKSESESGPGKENAMFALEVLVSLFLVRLVLPVGLLLLVGEWIRNRQNAELYGR